MTEIVQQKGTIKVSGLLSEKNGGMKMRTFRRKKSDVLSEGG
jgi:hypothetical protein